MVLTSSQLKNISTEKLIQELADINSIITNDINTEVIY